MENDDQKDQYLQKIREMKQERMSMAKLLAEARNEVQSHKDEVLKLEDEVAVASTVCMRTDSKVAAAEENNHLVCAAEEFWCTAASDVHIDLCRLQTALDDDDDHAALELVAHAERVNIATTRMRVLFTDSRTDTLASQQQPLENKKTQVDEEFVSLRVTAERARDQRTQWSRREREVKAQNTLPATVIDVVCNAVSGERKQLASELMQKRMKRRTLEITVAQQGNN